MNELLVINLGDRQEFFAKVVGDKLEISIVYGPDGMEVELNIEQSKQLLYWLESLNLKDQK